MRIILSFVLILVIHSPGFSQVLNPENGHYYQYIEINSPSTWERWADTAAAHGGYVATISDSSENSFVSSLISRLSYLGGSDTNTEGFWYWVNGEFWSYENWASGQPDNENGSQNYLMMDPESGGKWVDGYDLYPNLFVDSVHIGVVLEYSVYPDSIKTLSVPLEYSTIQEAIDAAGNRDTISIGTGIFSGPGNINLDTKGKCLVFKGSGEGSFIDGDHTSDGILIRNNSECATELIDLIILHTENGIVSFADSLTLKNCLVTINDDWGIVVRRGVTVIDSCLVFANDSGGIYIDTSAQRTTIIKSEVVSNYADGILGYSLAPVIIQNSNINSNFGNGINLHSFSNIEITQNTIANNHLNGVKLLEYLSNKSSGTVLFTNNVVFNNSEYGIANQLTELDISCCLFNLNDSGDFSGNITVSNIYYSNPYFCSMNGGDYRVQSFSECLPENNSCGELIGAYGLGCTDCCTDMRGNVDYDPWDFVDISDLVYLVGYSFTSGPSPICFEEADVDGNQFLDIGDIVYLVTFMFDSGPEPQYCL